MIVVPPNVNPGDTFCLEVHHDAEGGAMVTVAEVNSLLLMLFICFEGSYIYIPSYISGPPRCTSQL
jgi:hypothetical protein